MSTLIESILKLTDHRDRDLLEFTLSKALVELLPIQRSVIARVMHEDGEKRWLEVVRLDAKGGGKIVDPLRVEFQTLPRMGDAPERLACLQHGERLEIAWAGEEGPRITMLPLFAKEHHEDEGVLELHSEAPLTTEELLTIDCLCRIYRNMHALLAYSDRDALTGLRNRKSLEDSFYSAVLEELDAARGDAAVLGGSRVRDQERRHRVPANYWLGSTVIDNFALIADRHGHQKAQEALLLVARVLNSTFRTCDRLYRFEGGHFGVLLPCPDEALVLAAFERFRAQVERVDFPQVGRLTVSSGFTRVTEADSPSTALEKTAHAVDFAQRSGCNQVCSHRDLVQQGLVGLMPRASGMALF